MGVLFDKDHPITKSFSARQAVLFEKASSLDISPAAFEHFKFSYLVKSHNKSFTTPELKEKMKMGALNTQTMALEVQPKQEDSSHSSHSHSHSSNDKKDGFRLVVFGDSDFLSNRYIYEGANRDLALNTFVALTGEEELISIRPKQPKGTKITLNRPQRTGLILLYITLPFIFLLTGLWLWFKRREA